MDLWNVWYPTTTLHGFTTQKDLHLKHRRESLRTRYRYSCSLLRRRQENKLTLLNMQIYVCVSFLSVLMSAVHFLSYVILDKYSGRKYASYFHSKTHYFRGLKFWEIRQNPSPLKLLPSDMLIMYENWWICKLLVHFCTSLTEVLEGPPYVPVQGNLSRYKRKKCCFKSRQTSTHTHTHTQQHNWKAEDGKILQIC
jgi:hypothetical protein